MGSATVAGCGAQDDVVHAAWFGTGELEASEAEKDRELAGAGGGGEGAPLETSLMTPLTVQALRRWDARSASQQSLVSSVGGTTLYDDSTSRASKKLK